MCITIRVGLLSEYKDGPTLMHKKENNTILTNDADDLLNTLIYVNI